MMKELPQMMESKMNISQFSRSFFTVLELPAKLR